MGKRIVKNEDGEEIEIDLFKNDLPPKNFTVYRVKFTSDNQIRLSVSNFSFHVYLLS